MKKDAELLRDYVEGGSETAFKELVEQHLDLVYSVALRHLGGDAHLAKDVAQTVFADLARKAASLCDRTNLVGWLYTSACFAAAKLVRTERRRSAREQEVQTMHGLIGTNNTAPEWEELRPLVDNAMLELKEAEREAVLMRFFAGQSFAAIGAAQKLSEDSARKRVERALDKLQALLARKGLTSTAVALGMVLSQQAVVAAPSGLATSISGMALASAAGTTGLGIGASFLKFMAATKFSSSTGSIAAAVVLFVSLCMNAYLAANFGRGEQPVLNETTRQSAPDKAPASAGLTSLDFIRDADLPTLRDALYAAGASETRARQVVFGVLRRRYREAMTQRRLARIERGWWKDETRTLGITRASQYLREERVLLKELVEDKIEALFGLDYSQAGVLNARYSYMPEEVRMQFARLERERFLPAEWVPTGDPEVDAKTEAEWGRFLKEREAEREKILAGLTPEQRREHDMRYGQLGARLMSEYRIVPNTTEEEFRKLYQIAQDSVGGREGERILTASGAGLAVIERRDVATSQAVMDSGQGSPERLVAELGYDRAMEYLLAGSAEYRAVATVAQQIGLPPTTAARIAQLAAEAGTNAAAIHKDAALNLDQRRAALIALQHATRAKVNDILPAEAQQKMPPPSMAWLDQMSTGQYRLISPGIPGRTSASSITVNISANAPNLPASMRQIPSRPVGN